MMNYKLKILKTKIVRKFFRGRKVNILFLDVDGVVCPVGSYLNAYSEKAIYYINSLIEKHSLKVILVSGRRQSERMLSLTVKGLKEAGLKADLPEIDILLDGQRPEHHDFDSERSDDIFSYIDKNPEVGKFLIIDDEKRLYKNDLDLDLFLVAPNDPEAGLAEVDFRRADLFLNNGFEKNYRIWGNV